MTDQRQLPLEKGAEVALVLYGPGAEKYAFWEVDANSVYSQVLWDAFNRRNDDQMLTKIMVKTREA
jgi:hypothetical protein